MVTKQTSHMPFDFEIFTLCDGAYNYNGRLTIVGTFDSIFAQSFPWRQDVGVAMRFRVPSTVDGRKKISIQLLDSKGELIFAPVETTIMIPPKSKGGAVQIGLMLSGVVFTKEGDHQIVVSFDNKIIKNFHYAVVCKK